MGPPNLKTIILTTLNARYAHASIGLRYLYANMGGLQAQTQLLEFTINDPVRDIAERLLTNNPDLIGIGVYIWNALQVKSLLNLIKQIRPQTVIVLGGPEVSHTPLRVDLSAADFIIAGEADLAFVRLCKTLFDGQPVAEKRIQDRVVDLNQIQLPYAYYSDEDIQHRILYFEASRGCPFRCEFCLSSIESSVRDLETEKLLQALESLWLRGARSFKFVDRTFNLNIRIANRLLDYFITKESPYFVHFEVIPDHFPGRLKQRIEQFPAASLQLEIGIQTFNPQVANNIHRKLNLGRIEENIGFLDRCTSAHLHLDLIVGLPGEDLASFGAGLDHLCSITCGEIQIGILKKLSGTTLSRHDATFGMIYSTEPPYEILQNNLLGFAQIQDMKRFARFWDLYYNSGNFSGSIRLLWPNADIFDQFWNFARWIYQQTRSTWKISLNRQATLLYHYLTTVKKRSAEETGTTLAADLLTINGRKLPLILLPFAVKSANKNSNHSQPVLHNPRQVKRNLNL